MGFLFWKQIKIACHKITHVFNVNNFYLQSYLIKTILNGIQVNLSRGSQVDQFLQQ